MPGSSTERHVTARGAHEFGEDQRAHFLKAEWPQLHAEARNAEHDVLFDPRTTCLYAPRTVEHAVKWIYRTQNLPERGNFKSCVRAHR